MAIGEQIWDARFFHLWYRAYQYDDVGFGALLNVSPCHYVKQHGRVGGKVKRNVVRKHSAGWGRNSVRAAVAGLA